MDITYSKNAEGKLAIEKKIISTEDSVFTLDQLKQERDRLLDDRDAFQAKMQLEIDGWNQAITEVDQHISNANSLGVK